MLQNILLVALGSALGGSLRYLTSLLPFLKSNNEVQFIPTLVVNSLGSFLIGIGFVLFLKENPSPKTSLFLLTGILGGFTTFSGFSLELYRLIENGQTPMALSYLLGSVLLGIAFAAFGIIVASKF